MSGAMKFGFCGGLFWTIIVSLWLTVGCSSASKTPDKKSRASSTAAERRQAEKRASQALSNPGEAAALAPEEKLVPPTPPTLPTAKHGEDLGEPGTYHEYVLSPGSTEECLFRVKLNYDVLAMDTDPKHCIDPASMKVEQRLDYWKKRGAGKELVSIQISEHRRKVKAYVINIRDIAVHADGGRLYEFTNQIDAKTQLKMHAFNTTLAVLTELGDARTWKQVAALPKKEVFNRLGRKQTVRVPGKKGMPGEGTIKKLYLTDVELIEYYATIRFRLTMPEDAALNTGCESWHRIYATRPRVGAVSLKLAFTHDGRSDSPFHVRGPDETP